MTRVVMLSLAVVAGCGFRGSPDIVDSGVGEAGMDADPMTLNACLPLPPPTNTTVTVGNVTELAVAILNARPNTTILLADGDYLLNSAILLATPDVTLRSASDDATKVRIDGRGLFAPLILVRASRVTIASLTLAASAGLAVSIEPSSALAAPDITGVTVYDVTFRDQSGPQITIQSASGSLGGPYADDGSIACSRFLGPPGGFPSACSEITGIDAALVRGWTVRNNLFENLSCATSGVRTVVFDDGSRDTRIVNNRFINSQMNIRLGDSGGAGRPYTDARPPQCQFQPDHWGGVVCNNLIVGLGVPMTGGPDFEEGISAWNTCDTWIMHNTIVSPPGSETETSIEYRYAGTYVHLVNNLLLKDPDAEDGATADATVLPSNKRYVANTDFIDAAAGDLHLSGTAPSLVAAPLTDIDLCRFDADGKPRNLERPTAGAYER